MSLTCKSNAKYYIDVEKVACERVIISAGILLRWHHMTFEVPGSVCGRG
jgi:hypothetical protein